MLGRHKSWVNRRLALIEKLTDEAREALRLGLLTPTQAHHLTQLQRCNQNAAMQSASEHALTSRELSETVKLLQSASTQEQEQFVLEKPREAIRQSQDTYVHPGRSELQACDRPILLPSFVKLQNEASILIETTIDFIKELQQP